VAGSNAFTETLLIRSSKTFWQENSGSQWTTAAHAVGSARHSRLRRGFGEQIVRATA
jgi:hypothetical protein